MKNFFKKYLYVFEFIGVAIILAVGILAKLNPVIFLYIIGLILIVFGLLRLIPLLKTTKDNILKIIYTFEIALNIVAGIILLLEAGKEDYSRNLLRYIVGSVFYLRGLIYFFSTTIRRESTDYPKFFTHIGFFTLGPVVFTNKAFNEENLGWVVLVLAILSALFIAVSGYKNYKNSRYEQLAKDEIKKIKIDKKEKTNEVRKEDPLPKKENVIIPEEEKQDEVNL